MLPFALSVISQVPPSGGSLGVAVEIRGLSYKLGCKCLNIRKSVYLCSVKACRAHGRQDHIVHKTAFTGRSVFDAIRISQIPKQSIKNKATVNALVVYVVPAFRLRCCYLCLAFAGRDAHVPWRERPVYDMHARGAFSVARSDRLGNARAFIAWNEQLGIGSTLFYALM